LAYVRDVPARKSSTGGHGQDIMSSRPLGEISSTTALEGRRQNIVGVQNLEPLQGGARPVHFGWIC